MSDDDARVVDGVDVDAVVVAVTSCSSVSGMAERGLGGAVTLLPGRRVVGVRVAEGVVRVDVCAQWNATAAKLADEVRAATAGLLHGHRLHVVVADIADPDDAATASDAAGNGLPAREQPAAPATDPAPSVVPDPSDRPASPS